jgi:hypothetical protein
MARPPWWLLGQRNTKMNITDLTNSQNPLVVSNGCIAYFSLNEGSGSVAHDFSGTRNNGTLFNSPQWIAGRFGSGLNTNSSMAYISCSITVPINFTVAYWTSFPVLSSYSTFIFGNNTTGNQNAVIIVNPSHLLGVYDNDSGSNMNSCGYSVSGLTGWHHIAAVGQTSSSIQFYVDGLSVGTSSNATKMINSTRTFANVGGFVAGGENWGMFDDVRIYNRSLSAGEINMLYKTV